MNEQFHNYMHVNDQPQPDEADEEAMDPMEVHDMEDADMDAEPIGGQ